MFPVFCLPALARQQHCSPFEIPTNIHEPKMNKTQKHCKKFKTHQRRAVGKKRHALILSGELAEK
jgi:hypothetical protein